MSGIPEDLDERIVRIIDKLEKETEKTYNVLKTIERTNHIKDKDALLEAILREARKITNADAGSIYLVDNGELVIEYVQNDTLLAIDPLYNKYIYTKQRIRISEKSIAGYCALKKEIVEIEDAYNLKANVPYSFNKHFDNLSSYRTKSILAIPLLTSSDELVGVLQLINAKDENGNIVPFSERDKLYAHFFANNAASTIEKTKMTREIILRMIKMAELRDPKETGNHVNRVASYTIEIYQKWAERRNIPENVIKYKKDVLRIAAMLHDVGKVAISDKILKKEGKLDDEEYKIMKTHTVYGARLFINPVSDWDTLASQIALNHHERWDGNGYPGHIDNLYEGEIIMGPGKKGEEIPLEARIVAIADVYDALISKRVYKEAWQENEVIDYIKSQAGKQFDPELVEIFIEIYDIIKAIRLKYSDEKIN